MQPGLLIPAVCLSDAWTRPDLNHASHRPSAFSLGRWWYSLFLIWGLKKKILDFFHHSWEAGSLLTVPSVLLLWVFAEIYPWGGMGEGGCEASHTHFADILWLNSVCFEFLLDSGSRPASLCCRRVSVPSLPFSSPLLVPAAWLAQNRGRSVGRETHVDQECS